VTPRALLPLLLAAFAVSLAAGCNELSIDGYENPYTGGSIPWGKGPVVAAGYVVDGSRDRAPVRGVTVEALDSHGVTRRNRTDRRGIFYFDGIAPGLTAYSVGATERYLPFSCAIDAPTGARLTASISLYPQATAPDLSQGGVLGDFAATYPGSLVAGAPSGGPSLGEPFAPYASLLSYVCVTESAACLDIAGEVVPLARGQATIHAFFEGAHSEQTVTVTAPVPATGGD
jgi:hypothetical protein